MRERAGVDISLEYGEKEAPVFAAAQGGPATAPNVSS
jgi:hypothetical protein